MKKILVLVGVLLLTTQLLPAADFSLFGAWWDESDPGDVYGMGVRMSTQEGPWALDFSVTWLDDATYYWYGWDYYYTQEISTIPLEVGFRYIADSYDSFRPYIGGGAGYYLNDARRFDVDDSWGYYGLVGFNFGHPQQIDFFAEAIYRWVDVDFTYPNPTGGPAAEGTATLDGLGINMGVVFHF